MAPKKADTLLGKRVVAPRSLWPDYPLPRGQTGWEGKVVKKKDASHHFVTFPGDNEKYFFADADIRKWVVEEEEEEEEEEAPAAAARPPSPHKRPAPSAAESGGSRKPAAAAVPGSSKKAKAAAGSGMSRERLLEAIQSNLEDFTTEQVRAVYEAVLKVKLERS